MAVKEDFLDVTMITIELWIHASCIVCQSETFFCSIAIGVCLLVVGSTNNLKCLKKMECDNGESIIGSYLMKNVS